MTSHGIKLPERYPDMADPQARPRHTGIASFFRTPIADDPTDADIAVLGIPFDGGVTHRSGARHGPRAVREQSTLLRRHNAATGCSPFAEARVRDLGDCWIEQPYELAGAHREIEALLGTIAAAGAAPLCVGGDHSVTLPILRAIAKDRPLGLIHVDAHPDTGGDYMGSRFHHGAPFSRAVEEGLIEPKRCIQIGIRGTTNEPGMWEFSERAGMRIVGMDEFADKGWRWAAEEARRVAGEGPVYLSYDIDSLDPAFAPGTGTPEVGGITPLEALRFLRALEGIDVAAADLVEVAPAWDPSYVTALNGATILYEILCLMVVARRGRATAAPAR
jgi:guanidinopropionase